MRFLPRAHPNELPGDHLLRKARRCMLLACVALVFSAPLYIWLGAVWSDIRPLGGMLFVLASALIGLGLIMGPVLAVLLGLLALFLRVESRYAARKAAPSAADHLAVKCGFVVSFLPALLACVPAAAALISGRDAWPGNAALNYWTGVAIWLAAAAILSIPAGLYWRSQRRKLTSRQP